MSLLRLINRADLIVSENLKKDGVHEPITFNQ